MDMPMKVQRIQTAHGSHIEPAFNASWSPLEQLQWKAAVVEADTGIVIEVAQGRMRRNGFKMADYYSYQAVSQSGTLGGFIETWAWLNGVSAGYEITQAMRPDWSEVVERNLRVELADLQMQASVATVLCEAALRHVEGERDRARALAVRLEQEIAGEPEPSMVGGDGEPLQGTVTFSPVRLEEEPSAAWPMRPVTVQLDAEGRVPVIWLRSSEEVPPARREGLVLRFLRWLGVMPL